MSYILFLDDEREPSFTGAVVVRNYETAISLIQSRGIPEFLCLDHDLGEEKTGYDFVKWLCQYADDNHLDIRDMKYDVHSQNPIGRCNMQNYLESYMRYQNEKFV